MPKVYDKSLIAKAEFPLSDLANDYYFASNTTAETDEEVTAQYEEYCNNVLPAKIKAALETVDNEPGANEMFKNADINKEKGNLEVSFEYGYQDGDTYDTNYYQPPEPSEAKQQAFDALSNIVPAFIEAMKKQGISLDESAFKYVEE